MKIPKEAVVFVTDEHPMFVGVKMPKRSKFNGCTALIRREFCHFSSDSVTIDRVPVDVYAPGDMMNRECITYEEFCDAWR